MTKHMSEHLETMRKKNPRLTGTNLRQIQGQGRVAIFS